MSLQSVNTASPSGHGAARPVRVDRHRRHPAALAIATLAVLMVMAWAQYRLRVDADKSISTVVFVASAWLAAIALAGRDDTSALEDAPTLAAEAGAHRVLGSIVVAAGVLATATASGMLSTAWHTLFPSAAVLLLLGVAALAIGLRFFDVRKANAASTWTAAEVGALAGILALAALLRFHHFSKFPDPYGIFAIEEPQTGMGGAMILLHGSRPWEFLLDQYLSAAGQWLWGPSLFAIRVPFTVFSTLTVVPMYLLLRQLVRKPAALFATFLLAVSTWHLLYARVAHNIFLTTFFVVIVLALLVRVERTHRLALFPWIGLLTGYTLYTYAGYRGTSVWVVLFLVLAAARHWIARRRTWSSGARALQGRMLRRDLVGAAVVAFVVLSLALPISVEVSRHPEHSYFEAANRSLLNSDYYTRNMRAFVQQRLTRIADAAAIFLHVGDNDYTSNSRSAPMLDPVTGTLFVGGFLYAVCFPKRRHNLFFAISFVFLFFGGTVFVQNLCVRRLQGIIPPVLVFAALFVDRLLAFAERGGRTALYALYALGAVAAAFTLAWSWSFFFTQLPTDPVVISNYQTEYTELIRLGREQLRGRYLAVISDLTNFFDPSDFYWLVDGSIPGEEVLDLATILPPHPLPKVPQALSVVVLHPYEQEGIADLLRYVYPGTVCREDTDAKAPQFAMTACDLPPAAGPPAAGPAAGAGGVGTLGARYALRTATARTELLQRQEPFISYALLPQACRTEAEGECEVEWNGTFEVPADVTARFFAEARAGTFKVQIDGRPAGTQMVLTAGAHQLEASARFPRRQQTGARLLWQLGESAPTLVPFYGRPPQ